MVHGNPNSPKLAPPIGAREAFALWSTVYDHQANPLLSLEQRFLSEAMRQVRDLDVVDVGCGTGRWLTWFAPHSPASLTGIDSSPEMVGRARRKLGPRATVLLGRAESLPLRHLSADLLLASFVASYVPELSQLAAEARRLVRPGGEVYLSDLHPATASACKWKRSFKAAETEVELSTCTRSIKEVISCFEAAAIRFAGTGDSETRGDDCSFSSSSRSSGDLHPATSDRGSAQDVSCRRSQYAGVS